MSDDKPDLSPVFARAEKLRPKVKAPDSPWTLPLGLAGVAVLGMFVFSALSSGRDASAQAQPTPPTKAAPQAPAQASAPPPAPAPAPMPQATIPLTPQPPIGPGAEAYLRAPTVVVDLAQPTQIAQATTAAPDTMAGPPAPASPEEGRLSADERFAARASGATPDATRAYQMRNLTRMVTQGAVIPAVLETAIDSDLPGGVRAIVSRDVKGFDGSRVLIPRGSHLIGQYKSAVAIGQTRAFVIWTRLITPQGVSIDIGSPAADQLGRGGLSGEVDSHFFRRFGASILLSVLTTGLQAAAANGGGDVALIIGSPTQANRVAEIALQKQIDIPVTIRVKQGTPLQVFVARDLDFSGVTP